LTEGAIFVFKARGLFVGFMEDLFKAEIEKSPGIVPFVSAVQNDQVQFVPVACGRSGIGVCLRNARIAVTFASFQVSKLIRIILVNQHAGIAPNEKMKAVTTSEHDKTARHSLRSRPSKLSCCPFPAQVAARTPSCCRSASSCIAARTRVRFVMTR
jgi:hypothetical protein